MRPQVLLAALAVVVILAAALPLAHGQGATPSASLCCDNCGTCTRSIPPSIQEFPLHLNLVDAEKK
uniref:Bowman-Birk serine protease inhibitors family domain-containing protein n=1 Tax=Aegilops tauschii TaxID=37682 RepID=M8BHZ6_AEGTA